jgi:hypothetical protein
VEPPADDGVSINSPRNLALEATFINHNFSQQVLYYHPYSIQTPYNIHDAPLYLQHNEIFSIDGRCGVVVGILAYYARGRGFDSRTVQTFLCMNVPVCIGSGFLCIYLYIYFLSRIIIIIYFIKRKTRKQYIPLLIMHLKIILINCRV